jgi:hypothetical protein
MFVNPQNINPQNNDYRLQADSPCLDAGDPNGLLDLDGTIADIGKSYSATLLDNSPTPTMWGVIKVNVLRQNYPNPFNPETWIPFNLAQDTLVTISIYDTKGQLIRTIALGNRTAGIYTTKDKAAYWNGTDSLGEKVASGVYYYQLQAGEFRATRKMVIVK